LDALRNVFVEHFVAGDDQFTCIRVIDVACGAAPDDAFVHRLSGDVVGAANPDAVLRAAVGTVDDHVLRYVYQTTGEITRVRRSQRRIRQTLTSAVRRDEVFQCRQPFTEVATDRHLDDAPGRVSHQAAHTRKLGDRTETTFGRAGDRHDRDWTERIERVTDQVLQLILRAVPHVDGALVAFIFGEQTTTEVTLGAFDHIFGFAQDVAALIRDGQVGDGDGRPGDGGIVEAKVFNRVHDLGSTIRTKTTVAAIYQILQALLTQCFLHETDFVGQDAIEDGASNRRDFRLVLRRQGVVVVAKQDGRMQFHQTEIVEVFHLV